MQEVIRRSILDLLGQVIHILEEASVDDTAELSKVSEKAVEMVATHKDTDIISISVLTYSISKTVLCFDDVKRKKMVDLVMKMCTALKEKNFGKYNRMIRVAYEVVRECSRNIKDHLDDVMQAARIKKGTALLERGLSIGQAAGLMGLSNWDLQAYAARTPAISGHSESMPAHLRMKKALELFGL